MDFIRAVKFIQRAHAGQTDKGGQQYWLHPYRVAGFLMNRYPEITEDELIAGLLHDVLEDAEFTFADLAEIGFSAKTLSIVTAVTRPKLTATWGYLSWITSIAESGNTAAMRVKLADLEDNLDPLRLELILPSKAKDMRERYVKAQYVLVKALAALEDV
jgi:(p)ppGpp synthase/HD superfamily hydrolase